MNETLDSMARSIYTNIIAPLEREVEQLRRDKYALEREVEAYKKAAKGFATELDKRDRVETNGTDASDQTGVL